MSYVKKVKEATQRKKTPPKSGGKRFIIWGGIFFFISTWMFVLGVLVGRGTAPVHFDIEKLQNELAGIKAALLREEQKRFKVEPDNLDREQELGFYEALKDTREIPELPLVRPKPLPKAEPSPEPVSQPQLREKALSKAPEPVVATRRWVIQVASLKDADGADQIVERLKKKGYSAYRVLGSIPGRGIWHRVRIGSYETRAEAEGMLKKLNQNKIKGIILQGG